MVKHLCLENYQAAANSALKFPPLRKELVRAVTDEVKQELRAFSKGSSSAKYDGDPLNLKTFKNEDLLEEASEQMPITHSIISGSSTVGVKYHQNKQAIALCAVLNT